MAPIFISGVLGELASSSSTTLLFGVARAQWLPLSGLLASGSIEAVKGSRSRDQARSSRSDEDIGDRERRGEGEAGNLTGERDACFLAE